MANVEDQRRFELIRIWIKVANLTQVTPIGTACRFAPSHQSSAASE
jgi:hypothetical protein